MSCAQPGVALYADEGGAALVIRLLEAAPSRLMPGGRVLLEMDPAILPVGARGGRPAPRRTAACTRTSAGHERVVEAWS